MATEEGAIREDVQQQEGDAAPVQPDKKPDDYNPRAAALAAIAKSHADVRADEVARGGGPGETNARQIEEQSQQDDHAPAAVVKPAADDPAQVIAKADDEGELVLTPEQMKRVKIRTKVDGNESVVDGTKVLAAFQKHEAADGRLANAAEIERQARALLADAQKQQTDAKTKAEAEATQQQIDAALAGLPEIIKEANAALFEGDHEKANAGLVKAITTAIEVATKTRGPAPAQVDEATMVSRVVPEVQQQIEVKSALTKLYTDYPQLKEDQDIALVADTARKRFEAEGVSRPEAIAKAGDYAAQKFGFKKANADVPATTTASTTRDEKLAAKKGLDEPTSASARASTQEQPPKSASTKIAEIAKARGQQF